MADRRVLYLKGGNRRKKLILNMSKPENKEEETMKTGFIGQFQPAVVAERQEEGIDELLETAKMMKADAISIPQIETPKFVEQLRTDDIKLINIKYPLVPSEPKQGERVLAYAHIFFDKLLNEIVYHVTEPQMNEKDKAVFEEMKEFIQEKLDVNFAQIRKADAVKYIEDIFYRAVKYFKIRGDAEVLKYYVIRDFIGLESIEPLMQDKNIEDISCDGLSIPIYVYHRDTRLGSLRTNIIFTKKEELDSFVNKLAERTGKTISVAKPLLDGTLPDGSRIQATLGSDIARHGSNFTIRMFTEKPLTPVDMISTNTCDLKLMAYLWFLVEHESSILLSGGTASGKTSLLNVLSLFIKPQLKIVSIEDTAELRLPHAHWVPEVARSPVAEEGKVDMFELLRESLRQRPDYIIVGEVRGKEAYVLFQQMAIGHAGMATIHSDNFSKLIDRLTTAPISLPANLIQNLDLILFVKRVKQGRIYKRRVSEVIEVLGYDNRKNEPIINEVIKWDPLKDAFRITNASAIMRKIAGNTGMGEKDIQKEIIQRSKVLRWCVEHNVRDYKKFASIINLYYFSPDFLLNKIEGGL